MSAADEAAPITTAQAKALFGPLAHAPALILAVSGGPDSTALLVLATRWRAALARGPALVAVTVDHGLRRQSGAEARAVARLARRLGVRHRTLRWSGNKPTTGLQQAAREARYRLLAQAAHAAKAPCIVTAHTLDDQAETVLIRMMRGSGPSGLAAMARVSPLPLASGRDLFLVRPFLDVPKARLLATLARERTPFADDPSNRDALFTRARLRAVMPALAREGLDARRLAILASRLRRAEAAIEVTVGIAARALADDRTWPERGPVVFDSKRFSTLPAEVALRLLGRAIAHCGDEGPVELGKLEALFEAVAASAAAGTPMRRTLAGAVLTLRNGLVTAERAPPRRIRRLTTASTGRRPPSKPR